MSASTTANLAAARRYCRDVTRERARNFYYGLRLLPGAKRDALYTLYSWMRQADDFADGGAVDRQDARRRLEAFRIQTVAVLTGATDFRSSDDGNSDELLWVALDDLSQQCALDEQLFHDMIDGQLRDLDNQPYTLWDELIDYCHKVASSVGVLCIEIWGYSNARAHALAIQRGVAFQLTNILRDVQEDYDIGRVYLPLELFKQHSITPEQLQVWSEPDACTALILDVVARAQQAYGDSAALESLISADCRPTLRAMTDIYHGLLERIRQNPAGVVRGPRIQLNALTKLSIAGRALWRKRFAGSELDAQP